MQHSKSLGSFATSENTDVPLGVRPRARSSLDTFVIPGRTRIPSSKPDPVDLQITQTLLNPNMIRAPWNPQRSQDDARTQRSPQYTMQAPRSRNEIHDATHQNLQPPLYKVRPEILKRPPPQIGGREIIIIPHRRPHTTDYEAEAYRQVLSTPEVEARRVVYDGAHDSSFDSRVTSTTWSTISHRVFTDSSGSSRVLGASHFLGEYNSLATQHGLPELAVGPREDKTYTKSASKTHNHGWLARKFFNRSTSTFNLKVKASYKPVSRKRSLGGIPKMPDGGQRNILKDKSLEEISRLGGLGVLILPYEFALDKLTLPTCLTATATYLFQHGCNTPGLFRISGQTNTVNALYDFYAYQFYDAGSPSKVQETVGSGLLPTHIDHTVPDVASLFKKILISLPGGLLGSLELFEAFRAVFFKLTSNPDIPDEELTTLRAKLIALALSSITSTYRFYLIQAVIGLVAYFGSEAEKARAEVANAPGGTHKPSSELMGYQSLGVVLGPLLLGNLTDSIDVSPGTEDAPRKSSESVKKATKKQKRLSVVNKLDKDPTLSAHVDRANLTASVMELLLMVWKDVVKQFRIIHGTVSSSLHQIQGDSQGRKATGRVGSRLTLRTSEEDMLFFDLLRGRTLPDEFRGEVKMKRKVKIAGRSPMSHGASRVSEDGKVSGTIIPTSDKGRGTRGSDSRYAAESSVHLVEQDNSTSERKKERSANRTCGLQDEHRSHSDAAMDQMAMGTILPRLQDSPVTPTHRNLLRRVSQLQTTPNEEARQSTSQTPETALKDVQRPVTEHKTSVNEREISIDKPLPPIGDVQRAEFSPGVLKDAGYDSQKPHEFPTRQSSLPLEKQLPMRPVETFETLAEYKARAGAADPPSRVSRRAPPNESTAEETQLPKQSQRNSVKFLTQKFAEASRANRDAEAKDSTIPKVYAYVHALPSPKSPRPDDPFLSPINASPEKESLIPEPIQGSGRRRKAEGRSPSPPKRAAPKNYLKKRPSVFNIVRDDDAEIVKTNTVSQTVTPPPARNNLETFHWAPSTTQGVSKRSISPSLCIGPTRPLSAFSSESLRRMRACLDEPHIAHHIPTRVVSIDINTDSPSINVADTATNIGTLERTGSINATLHKEICRLQRLLEQRSREVQATRRSLDAVRDAKEGGALGGGVNKGTLSEEVREARREVGIWKRRAEWAEKRLAGLGIGGSGKGGACEAASDEKRQGFADGKEEATKTDDGSVHTV